MEEAAQTVIDAVHSLWDESSQGLRSFGSEKEMQVAFREALMQGLPLDYHVLDKDAYPFSALGPQFSAWRAYDVGVKQGPRFSDWTRYDIAVSFHSMPIALLELSYEDTTVHHALHNGELKLLGNCDAVSVSAGRPYREERRLTTDDVDRVKAALSKIPVRGLFFVNGDERRAVLDERREATWWPTRDGNPKFRSAVMASETRVTLRQVLGRLAEVGLYCWFYSLCGEDRLGFTPYDGCTT